MEQKKRQSIPTEVITRSVTELAKDTGNVYESVVVVGKRANQITRSRRDDLKSRLEEFLKSPDTLEEVYQNLEQIEISRYFERLPKSTIVATEEFLAGELHYRQATQEAKEPAKE